MTNLDLLLLKGANRDLTEENLAELRYTILTKGIPANSEGMVNTPRHPQPQPVQSQCSALSTRFPPNPTSQHHTLPHHTSPQHPLLSQPPTHPPTN